MNRSAVEIIPGLWLGNIKARFNTEFLKENGITHVINCATRKKIQKYAEKPEHMQFDSLKYIDLNLRDKGDELSKQLLYDSYDKVSDLILTLLQQGSRLLVHCYAGKYRSPSIIMAFLIKQAHMTYTEVYEIMKKIYPNISSVYSSTLVKFEQKLKLSFTDKDDI